eukprot:comp19359_c0_seq1/m.22304 comp19359_c0_seq1/g.22304  ORF comp19359_c0_seq1/g.22304 comp19359_c0_seq1/m.22304 type:complete len:341 (-) comp19359_c0_seq1:16-1038(-)
MLSGFTKLLYKPVSAMSTYKAVVVRQFGPPEVMQLEDRPALVPAQGQVLIDIKAIGVNPVETYIRSGQYARLPELPYTPGSDAAGIVRAVGAGVSKVKPGDRVYVSGTLTGAYATAALARVEQTWHLPEKVSFEQGAAIPIPYATAYRALFQRAHTRPGSKVLIHGASGGVGVAAVQLARAAGALVIGSAGSQQGMDLILREGAHHAVNHKDQGYTKKIMELAPGGLDVIIEMLANVNLGNDLPMLAPEGCVAVVGSRGTVEINPRDTMMREASILGVILARATQADLEAIHSAVHKGLEDGSLRPMVGRVYNLNQAAEAHKQVISQSGGAVGKIVLKVE